MKAMKLRLARLERNVGTTWETYQHLPMAEWPDAALLAYLGLSLDTPDAKLLRIVMEFGT